MTARNDRSHRRVIDVVGNEMLVATLPVAEESYLSWAPWLPSRRKPRETPVQAIEDAPAGSSLPGPSPTLSRPKGRDADGGH